MVLTSNLRSRDREFDSRCAGCGHYRVVTTWMDDCLRTGKPSQYITNTKVNSAVHPSGVDKSNTGVRWGTFTSIEWQITLCDPVWQVTLRSSKMGYH